MDSEFDSLIDSLLNRTDLESSRLPSSRSLKIASKREMTRVDREAALDDVIAGPPEPGHQLHIISAAKFDFWTWIPVLLRWTGPTDALWISTWTVSRPNVDELFELMDAGQIGTVHFLTGTYFKRRESAVAAKLIDGIQRRPPSRFSAFQNHAKVTLLGAGDYWLSIEGSANLTANPRLEQYVLTNDRTLYDWHAAWMHDAFSLGDKALAEPVTPRTRKPGYSQRRAGLGVLAAVCDNRSRQHALSWKAAPVIDADRCSKYADLIAEVIRHWLPHPPDGCVVTVPPQGASYPGPYYAAELARAVATRLKLRFRFTLNRQTAKTHHGRLASLTQGDFVFATKLPPPAAIVIDDLITTGTTMRTSIETLATAGVAVWGFAYAGS